MSDLVAQIELLISFLQTSRSQIVVPLLSQSCNEKQAWLVLLCLQFRRTYGGKKKRRKGF